MGRSRKYWLMKSEPNAFSIWDLEASKGQRTYWDGVRNYQARNILRNEIKKGDGVLFYHSRQEPIGIVGEAVVIKEGYPDHTAFDLKESHYDPKSDPKNPSWYMVDIQLVRIFKEMISLKQIKKVAGLSQMLLIQKGMRLSVQPVRPYEWKAILKLVE